YQHGYGTPPTF
nr:immunoglobulin light chain junction region [Macaca mulatta]